MKKYMVTTDQMLYQYNADVSPPNTPWDQKSYVRDILAIEARDGVTAEDVFNEYWSHVNRLNDPLNVMNIVHSLTYNKPYDPGLTTIGAESDCLVVCFSIGAFEKMILGVPHLMPTTMTDSNIRILDKERIKKAIYECFFRDKDGRMIREARDSCMRVLKSHARLV